MRRQRRGLEFRMILARHKPRVVRQFNHLDQPTVRRYAAKPQPLRLQAVPVIVVEFVPVPVPFAYFKHPIGGFRLRSGRQHARVGAQPHGAALFRDLLLLRHQVDHRVRRGGGKLGTHRPRQPGYMARKFHHGALHAQADAEKGNPLFPRIPDGLDLALNATVPKPARHQHTSHPAQQRFNPLLLNILRFHHANADLHPVGDAPMHQGLVNALVGVLQPDVFAHHRDLHLAMRRRDQGLEHGFPVGQVDPVDMQVQLLHQVHIQVLARKVHRYLVDGMGHVLFLDHQVVVHVAEHGQLFAMFAAQRLLAPADQDVGNDPDGPQNAHRLLGGLGLEFLGRLDVRHQGDMQEHAVLASDLMPELADRLQERQRLDVTHRPADLVDHDVHIVPVHRGDGPLDLVGHVRDHLHGLAQVPALTLTGNHRPVDPAGRKIAFLGAGDAAEPLVMTQVQVRLGAINRHVDLAMLVRRHGAGIHVEVRIHLLQAHPVPAPLEQQGHGSRRQPLAEGGNHPARHEYVLGHTVPFRTGRSPNDNCPVSNPSLPDASSTGIR